VILCVAGNPSVDKLFEVDRIRLGAIHRPDHFLALAGGKGLHVAQVARQLGAEAVVTGVLGGHTGQWVAEQIAAQGIDGRFVWADAETRSSLSVADRSTGNLTEFYEDGARVSAAEWSQVEAVATGLLGDASWLVLAGSLPPGVPDDAYVQLIGQARRAHVPSAIDTRGSVLAAAVRAGPDLVKINSDETAELLARPVNGLDEACRAAWAIRDQLGGDGHAAAVTLRDGVGVVATDGSAWIATVSARGSYPVGSGDVFLAGLLVALERGDDWPTAIRVALGAAAANAEMPGAAALDLARARELAAGARCWAAPAGS
jgi:1-phosphofructokinase/tagatose 6-phosphate kinase